MLLQSVANQTVATVGTATAVGYRVVFSDNSVIVGAAGIGTPATGAYSISLQAVDVAILGPVTILFLGVGDVTVGVVNETIVRRLPGAQVIE